MIGPATVRRCPAEGGYSRVASSHAPNTVLRPLGSPVYYEARTQNRRQICAIHNGAFYGHL
jgi:hypothetical protein